MPKLNLKPSLFFGLLLAVTLFQVACSSSRYDAYSKGGQHSQLPATTNVEHTTQISSPPPWDSWAYGKDLQGQNLNNVALLQADEYLKNSAPQKALEQYASIQTKSLSPSEREVLAIRRASAELQLGQADASLRTLSTFFSTSGRSVADVDARFALVFAYAYGYKNDFDQSLAWFSRAYKASTPKITIRQQAQQGAKALLRTIPTDRFEALPKTWSNDFFINQAIGAERSIRSRAGYSNPVTVAQNRFWDPAGKDHTGAPTHTTPGSISLAALLPLSGQFANLGNHIKNGIELALESVRGTEAPVPLTVRDTTADPSHAVAAAQELMSRADLSAVLGPLLSEEATQVSEVARQHRFPLITFSKSERFQVGDGVFRIGPTASSQVTSLLEIARSTLALKRYAIIFPDEPGGREFEELFRNKLHELSLELVYQMAYPKNDHATLIGIAQEMEGLEVDAVFMPDGLLQASRFIEALSTNMRKRVRMLGTALWDNQPELARSSAVFDGVIFVSPFFAASPNPEVIQFVQSYTAKYRALPDFLAAQGFDATLMVASALKNQHEQQITFEQALGALDVYAGLTGSIQVDSSGEFRRTFQVVRFKSGAIRELSASN